MKLMASGDHHFDEHSRFAECLRVHAWIANEVALRKPDVFLDGGDIYERASTPTERAAVADWLSAIADVCPVVIAKGNHDRRLDCALLGRLRTRHPIVVEEAARVHRVAGAAIAAVAWPSRSSLAAAIGAPRSAEAIEDVSRVVFQDVLRGLGAELAEHDGPRVLLMHAMVNGSVTSTGQPLIGAEMTLGLDDLGLARPDMTILSHIHMPQAWTWNEAPVVYCGSPTRTAYGETEEKSVVYAEFDESVCGCSQGYSRGGCPVCSNRGACAWERLPTPATPMHLFEAAWSPEGLAITSKTFPVAERVRGAECRLRYVVDSDRREAAATAARELREQMLAAGAIAVKVEEVVTPTTRARAPEIGAARTIEDKLLAFWRAKKIALDDERSGRLMHMLAQLQSEAA